jgi:uncharacterized ion transporter superfamily protein YfcC
MKKFWEKHDLVKMAGFMVLLTVILTWLIPQGYFSSTSLSVGDITRVGIFDFFTYGLLGMYYFTVLVTFLFVLGGFYQVLSRTGAYQVLTDKIAKKFKGKETLFVLLLSFVLAAITAVTSEYFVVIAVLPFFITIMKKMGLDKMTGFLATFGAILVGILGSIYSPKIVGMNVQYLSVKYNTYIWVKVALFVIAYVLFSVFTVLHLKKTSNGKKDDAIEDMFEAEDVTKKKTVWPLLVVLILFALTTLIAYMPWSTAFGLDWFTKATTSVTSAKVFGSTIFKYILGNVQAFGAWDIFGVQVLMLIAALLVKWIYHIQTNDFLTSFGEGFKKTGKLVVLLLLAYLTLEFAVMFPVIPTIVDWFMKLSSKFNVLLGTVAGLFTSLFSVEYQYTLSLIGQYLASGYTAYSKQIAIMLQSTYGLDMMFAPTSAILLIGLSYLGISYKEWFKYIWKFLVAMLAVILIVLLCIC